jgi:hypothetical protein
MIPVCRDLRLIAPLPHLLPIAWIAVFMLVFVVKSADGMYGNFAGRDASRGMAKQSFDEGEGALQLLSSFMP